MSSTQATTADDGNAAHRHSPSSGPLLNIQFLRFVAATMVVLFHGGLSYRQMGGKLEFVSAPRFFGFAGVDIFFVISGFIIWTSNLDTKGMRGRVRYLYNRFARIYLGYWVFFLLCIGARLLTKPSLLADVDYAASFFLLPQSQAGQLLYITWTLSFELYFYGLFFLALFSSNRARLLGAAAAFILAADLYAHFALDAFAPGGFRNLSVLQRFLISPALLEFFLGCYLAHGIASGWKRFGKTTLAAGIVVLTLGATGKGLGLEKIPVFHNTLIFGGGAALVVYGLVIVERAGFVIWPRFSALMGGASYSTYLSHTIIFQVLSASGVFVAVRNSAFPASVGYVLLMALILGSSALFYVAVERPIYRFAKSLPVRIFARAPRRARTVAPPPTPGVSEHSAPRAPAENRED